MFQSSGVTSESFSNAPSVHESMNITYLSYQLKLEGAYIAGGSKTFSPNHLLLQPLSSAEVQLALVISESKSRDVPDARQV
jgi:hypothetical protein